MALILWINDYSVGVDALDADHIMIVSLMNQIDDLKQVGTEEAAVGTVVKVLLDVAHTHFRREEGILKSAYPLHSSVEFAIGNLWLATSLRYGDGVMATACCASLWNSKPRACERRRLKRKVNSSR